MPLPNTSSAAPNIANKDIIFNGFIGTVATLYKTIRDRATDYDLKSKYMGSTDPLKAKIVARSTALKLIAENVKTCGSVDDVKAILAEKDLKFKDFRLANDNVDKLGGRKRTGKSRKGKSRKGKSRKGIKGKSRKNNTRRR